MTRVRNQFKPSMILLLAVFAGSGASAWAQSTPSPLNSQVANSGLPPGNEIAWLTELASAQVARGDPAAALATLADLERTLDATPDRAASVARYANVPELAGVFARVGEVHKARLLLIGLPGRSEDIARGAANICAAGHVGEGLELIPPATRARKMGDREQASLLGAVAHARAQCGHRDEAAKLFARALKKASKLREPPSDELGLLSRADQARQVIMRRMIDARMFETLPASADFADPEFQLDLLLARARAGARDIAPPALELPRASGGYEPPADFNFRIRAARAEIFARLGAGNSADEEFSIARSLAIASGNGGTMADQLAQLAEIRLSLGDREAARQLLDEAVPVIPPDALSNHLGRWYGPALVSRFVRVYALLGDDAMAHRIMEGRGPGVAVTANEFTDGVRMR